MTCRDTTYLFYKKKHKKPPVIDGGFFTKITKEKMFLVRVDSLMYEYINFFEMWGENFDLVIGIFFGCKGIYRRKRLGAFYCTCRRCPMRFGPYYTESRVQSCNTCCCSS